jgi:hypothetical protein
MGLIITALEGRAMRTLLVLALLAMSVAGGLAVSAFSAQPAQACNTNNVC